MATPPFIDTNVFVRLLTGDEPDQSPRSLRLFDEIAADEAEAFTSDTVVFELVFTLTRIYGWNRQDIVQGVERLLQPAGLRVEGKPEILQALALFARHRRLSFGDCYHLCVAQRLGRAEFISFDRALDRVTGVTRIEPPHLPAS